MNHAANFIPIFTATCYRGNNNRPNNKAPAAWNAKVLLRERERERESEGERVAVGRGWWRMYVSSS